MIDRICTRIYKQRVDFSVMILSVLDHRLALLMSWHTVLLYSILMFIVLFEYTWMSSMSTLNYTATAEPVVSRWRSLLHTCPERYRIMWIEFELIGSGYSTSTWDTEITIGIYNICQKWSLASGCNVCDVMFVCVPCRTQTWCPVTLLQAWPCCTRSRTRWSSAGTLTMCWPTAPLPQ